MITSMLLQSVVFLVILRVRISICWPIVNGIVPRATDQFKFAVSLQHANQASGLSHFCGGTYIGNGWIVTANHCVVGFEIGTIYAFVGGLSLNKSSHNHLYLVEEKISHPDYNRISLAGDIALLRLESWNDSFHVLDDTIEETLSLPSKALTGEYNSHVLNLIGDSGQEKEATEDEFGSEECLIYGYGSATFYGAGSDDLQFGPVQPLGHKDCTDMLGPVVAPSRADSGMFCAIGYADACRGDSGGGLVCRPRLSTPWEMSLERNSSYILRGIISYGAGCGVPASPEVYTDVGFYWNWINEIISG
ncbi:putative trypsin-6 [Sabethes cyaneus]|uniref:putative trypsin-6 n=1 Tax=Sabethes cyaneus TaxID=53552 RepID=UPI00237D67F0|nr:putative trypsin-6 [Sabethes cyaneus]